MTKYSIFTIFLLIFLSSNVHASISCSNLTANDSGVDATSYATASISPSSKQIILLTVTSHIAVGPPVQPTASGNGLNWVVVSSNTTNHSGTRRTTMFRAMGESPTTGAITIDFGAETQLLAIWAVDQCSGVDTSGTDGERAIVQAGNSTGTGFATSATITLSTFASNANVGYGYMQHGTNETTNPGTGFTELSDNNINDGGIIAGSETEWKTGIPTNDNTVDWSWTTSSRQQGIAVELKAEPTTIYKSTLYKATLY